MACKNMTEALLEDVIEITWVFDTLMESNEIRSWNEIIENFVDLMELSRRLERLQKNLKRNILLKPHGKILIWIISRKLRSSQRKSWLKNSVDKKMKSMSPI